MSGRNENNEVIHPSIQSNLLDNEVINPIQIVNKRSLSSPNNRRLSSKLFDSEAIHAIPIQIVANEVSHVSFPQERKSNFT